MRTLLSIIFIALAWPLFGQPWKGDQKDKARELYHKFEREEVSFYRDRSEFTMPEPIVPPAATDRPDSLPDPVSLEYLFEGEDKLHIDSDPRLDQLVQTHINIGQNTRQLEGWRVQIYAGSGYQGANSIKTRSLSLFPDQQPYVTFESPNYVVRVGDFLDKEVAQLFVREIKEYFPGAFPVPDKVFIPKFRPEDND